MQFRSSHLRLAASIAAALVLTPVVGQWFIEYADELGFYERPVERTRAVIAGLTASAWFHWMGGAILGVALGVWLDSIVRRREAALIIAASGAPDPAPTTAPAAWVTPLDAMRLYLEATYWEMIERYEKEYAETLEASQAAQRSWERLPNDPQREQNAARLAQDAAARERNREVAYALANSALVDALRDGSLLGRGILKAGAKMGEEVDIPEAHWRILKLNHVKDTAISPIIDYIGVRISFPNRPSPDSRLPPPSDIESPTPQ